MTPDELAARLDHPVLAPDTTNAVVRTAVAEAVAAGLGSVTVSGCKVKFASILAQGTGLRVRTVVGGFPLGQVPVAVKPFETAQAVELGAAEVDMMMNVGFFQECSPDYLLREVREVVAAAEGLPVNVVLETGYLSDAEKVKAAGVAVEVGASGLVTCTGFGPGQATVEDVALLRANVPAEVAVIAAGGVRTAAQATALLESGAAQVAVTDVAAVLAAAK